MRFVQASQIPETAILRKNRDEEAFVDCYVTEVDGVVSQSTFIEAFYTTALFKVERALLGWLVGRPSSDFEAKQIAEGASDSFAAWRVEDRDTNQLLLADFTGRTKSWLMSVPANGADGKIQTRLYFGSAVISKLDARTGGRKMGFAFHALLGFHRLLLSAARSRILNSR